MFALAVALRPEIVERDEEVRARVEPNGKGQMVYVNKQPNLKLVKKCNMEKYKALAIHCLE